MRMIEELFDGNIQPCERPVRGGSPLQKLASLVMENNDALLALLDEAQQRPRHRQRAGREGWQAEVGHQQAGCTAECDGHRDGRGPAQGDVLLRPVYAPCMRRERGLYEVG